MSLCCLYLSRRQPRDLTKPPSPPKQLRFLQCLLLATALTPFLLACLPWLATSGLPFPLLNPCPAACPASQPHRLPSKSQIQQSTSRQVQRPGRAGVQNDPMPISFEGQEMVDARPGGVSFRKGNASTGT